MNININANTGTNTNTGTSTGTNTSANTGTNTSANTGTNTSANTGTGMNAALNAPEFLGWLGAPAKYAMALPEAKPTPSQMYCPRGVYLNERVLVVADSGNHRLLLWHLENGALPANHSDAQVVIGQPDFYSEGAKLLHLPTGVTMVGDVLLVADAWHHRILGWRQLPVTGQEAPDFVLGQRDLAQVEPNAGGEAGAGTMFWPYGLAYMAGRLYVADTGNRRVLYWNGLPDSFCAADGVIGQANFQDTAENRGQICANSFRWAHDLAGDEERLFIADAGNHRVLGFKGQPSADEEAVLLLGQTEFSKCEEFPYRPQSASCMRFPYSLSYAQGKLAVADTANNRVLIFRDLPEAGLALPACQVIGQPDFEANGENHWKAVTNDSLCWPYGIHLYGEILAIADSGNNRVMLWKI